MIALTRTREDYGSLAVDCLSPAASADLWEWCQAHLTMPNGKPWEIRRAQRFRHWYRVINARLNGHPMDGDPWAHRCEQLYFCWSNQIHKTALMHAAILYCLAIRPSKMALFMHRLQDLKKTRITKLQRQVETTGVLAELLPEGIEARDSALGSITWQIAASILFFSCAAVVDDIRSEDLELIFADEFDRYPADVEDYGDPIEQLLGRQRIYRASKFLFAASTPGAIAGHCWSRLVSGSHERMLVDCVHCGGAQDLDDRQIVLEGGRKLDKVPAADILAGKLARFACRHCGATLDARQVRAALDQAVHLDRPWCPGTWAISPEHPQGRWTPSADFDAGGRLKRIHPPETIIRSAWANALYSTDETLDTIAAKIAGGMQGTAATKKTVTNNECARPSIITITESDTEDISRVAQPPQPYEFGSLNREAKWLFLMFDQQGNQEEFFWWPWVLRAINPGGESWLVDAGEARSAAERDALEARSWLIGDKRRAPDRVGMDSANGNALFYIYLWASKKTSKRILLRGDGHLADGIPWQEVVDNPKTRRRTPKPSGVREYRIHPHYWRNKLWDRMRAVGEDKEALIRWWLPSDAPKKYLNSMTSEEQVTENRRVTGAGHRQVLVWRPRVISSTADKDTYRDDNHWWDAEASIAAAANILGWDRPVPKVDPNEKQAPPPPPSEDGWMGGYSA